MDSCCFGTVVVVCLITRSLQDLSVTEHPKNVTVEEGGNITLQCVFSENVNKCVWFRNRTAITINERYKYSNFTATDCSIEIITFHKIDAGPWHCSCAVNSEVNYIMCKSDVAFLTLTTTNRTIELPKTPTNTKPSNATTNDHTPPSVAYMTNILLFVVIGLLSGAMLLTILVYCYRLNKAKRKRNLKFPERITEPPITLTHHNSTPNLSQSTESICTLCHQHKPETCSPGGVWSARCYEHPLPEVEEQLPSYNEANLQHEDNLYEQIPNRQSMDYYMSIDEIKKQPPSTSMTMTNDNESVACSPLTMANDNVEATCNPLYEKITTDCAMANAGESEDNVDANESVRFEMGLHDALYTTVQPKTK